VRTASPATRTASPAGRRRAPTASRTGVRTASPVCERRATTRTASPTGADDANGIADERQRRRRRTRTASPTAPAASRTSADGPKDVRRPLGTSEDWSGQTAIREHGFGRPSPGSDRVTGDPPAFRTELSRPMPPYERRERTGWHELHDRRRRIDISAPGEARPLEPTLAELSHPPRGRVFERVVASAEVRKIARGGGAATRRVHCVIDIASPWSSGAAGESASLVAHAEESAELGARSIPIDRHRCARMRVIQHSVPPGGTGGEDLSGLTIDRARAARSAGSSSYSGGVRTGMVICTCARIDARASPSPCAVGAPVSRRSASTSARSSSMVRSSTACSGSSPGRGSAPAVSEGLESAPAASDPATSEPGLSAAAECALPLRCTCPVESIDRLPSC
jgi:hypothetical protein